MLETGVGLVLGGLITLLVVWVWVKKADSLAHYFGLSKKAKIAGDEK
jgi:peptidoglycan biosynthesis protein MviN/MurJ (putative lipid II flippase)